MFRYKGIVSEVRVSPQDAVNFFKLPWRKLLIGIQAPSPLQKPLSTEYLVQARDAARKAVGGVKKNRIAVSYFSRAREQFERVAASIVATMDTFEQLHGAPRPYRPMPKQSAGKPNRDSAVRRRKTELGHEVADDVVVVPGIEDDFLMTATLGQRSRHIQGLIAVERCHFDRHHVLYLQEFPPKAIVQRPPANRGLQVESEQRDNVGNCAAVGYQARF